MRKKFMEKAMEKPWISKKNQIDARPEPIYFDYHSCFKRSKSL